MVKSKIFKGKDIYITSGFGKRTYIFNGTKVSDFHYGVDYGTYLLKLPQYAIENGKIKHITITGSLGNCVYIEYPRLKKIFQHGHLDKILVEVGQTVDNNTIIGYTGQTGQTTGIHLHLGMFPNLDWNKNYYDRNWEDVSKYIYPNKTVIELANEVIQDKWDNYPKRKELIEEAGYDYSEVQKLVNEILNKQNNNKTVIELANEVIQGKWDNYPKRKELLEKAGYNYSEVQKLVNEILEKQTNLKKGDKVKVINAIQYDGKPFKTYYDVYDIIEVKGNRVVIGIGKVVTAAIDIKNIKKI